MTDPSSSGWHNPSAKPHPPRGPLTYDEMAQRLHDMEEHQASVVLLGELQRFPQGGAVHFGVTGRMQDLGRVHGVTWSYRTRGVRRSATSRTRT